jgi:hypothetical protein
MGKGLFGLRAMFLMEVWLRLLCGFPLIPPLFIVSKGGFLVDPLLVFCIDWLLGSKYDGLPVHWALAELARSLLGHFLRESPPDADEKTVCGTRPEKENTNPIRTLTKFTNSPIYQEACKFVANFEGRL